MIVVLMCGASGRPNDTPTVHKGAESKPRRFRCKNQDLSPASNLPAANSSRQWRAISVAGPNPGIWAAAGSHDSSVHFGIWHTEWEGSVQTAAEWVGRRRRRPELLISPS